VRANPPALFAEEAIPPRASTPAVSEQPPSKASSPKVKQEDLPLEPIARGRFEKVEPTIVEGEDLDVPTFLRRKLKR
jgi:cell division protein FtsZ